MCTNPIRILNPKKYVRLGSGQPLYLIVPCNHCVECRRRIQLEWHVRTYYECLKTFSQPNSYVLFDTLTYDDYHLPRLNDFLNVPKDCNFSCFSSYDVRQFTTALNTNIRRKGYPEGLVRYFITCEYGKEQYTSRPHYHCFFFVKDIPFVEMSYLISDTWQNGRTDGVRYRGSTYVKKHNTFHELSESSIRVIGYISKYVAKDFVYNDLVQKRLTRLMDYKYPSYDWRSDSECKQYYNELSAFVMPFHRQSKEFGSFFYDCHNINDLVEKGFFKFRCDDKILVIGLFPSMKRKLFYVKERKNGVLSWYKTVRGGYYDMLRAEEKVSSISTRLINAGLDSSVAFDMCFNQDRLLSSPVCSLDEVFNLIVTSNCVNDLSKPNTFRNYASVDYGLIRKPVYTLGDFGSKKDGFKKGVLFNHTLTPSKDSDFITLSDIQNYSYYSSYIADIQSQFIAFLNDIGEKAMAVERLKSRIKKLQKSLNYVCI